MNDIIPGPSLKEVMNLIELHVQHRVDAALATRSGIYSAAKAASRRADRVAFEIQDALKRAGLS